MCENVNINVSETNETINIVATEVQEIIDINVFETTEDVTLNITEQLIQVNVNKVTGGGEETLAETLVFGNNTGGTDILLNNDDAILLENNSSLRKGTYDFGQNGGISRVCGVDYEDMWQGGVRYVFDNNGYIRNATNCFEVTPEPNFDITKRFKVGSIWTLDDGTNYICTDATEGAAVWELYNVIPDVTGFVPYTGATEDVNLGEFGLLTGNVEFDNTPTNIPTTAGAMYWNDADGTADLILKGGNVKLQIGQESVIRVVNKTATNINLLEANYQAVRVTGAQGQRLKVDLAQATNDNLSAETIGLVTETINNNQEGFITTSGLVRNINTTGSLQGETWADGDILYLSPTTAGNVTKVKPTAPNHLVIIGYVVHAHANQGSIFVKVDNGYELDELHNVKITSAANNNVLAYTSATDIWENKTVETALGYTPVTNARTISTTAPLSGGGDLSANRTLSISQANTTTNGFLSSTDWNTFNNKGNGTVTSVSALTLGTTGTDLSSSVATGTTTPVITLNVPTASATNRGALSSTDWSTFNNKFTLPALTSGSVLFSNGTTIVQSNAQLFWDNTNNRLGIGTNAPAVPLDVRGGFNLYTALGNHYLTSSSVSATDSTIQFTRVGGQNGWYRFKFGGGLEIASDQASGECRFGAPSGGFFSTFYSNGSERMRIFSSTGNISINTTTDAGFRLDVNGTARVKAQSALSTEVTFSVRNSADTRNFLVVNGAGDVYNNGAGGVTTNTFFGENSGRVTTGQSNTFFGNNAGASNTGGNFNSFFGISAGSANVGGLSNCFFGRISGFNNTNGSNNSFYGTQSGRFIADGVTNLTAVDNSVFIGFDTRANGNSQTNQIVIGHNAIGAGSNTATLGNTSIVDTILRGRINIQQYATGSRPTYVKGALIYDSTLGKLVVGGNLGWEVVTSM